VVIIVYKELRLVFGQPVPIFETRKISVPFLGLLVQHGHFYTYCFFLLLFALEENSATHRNCEVYKFINDKSFVEYKKIFIPTKIFQFLCEM